MEPQRAGCVEYYPWIALVYYAYGAYAWGLEIMKSLNRGEKQGVQYVVCLNERYYRKVI